MAKLELITIEEFKQKLEEQLEPIREAIKCLQEEKDPNQYLNVTETANLLGVTPFTVREYTKRRILVRYKFGSQIRYKRSEVIDAIRRIKNPRTL